MLQESTPCEVRVHVFQGRYLPAADDSGTIDPYDAGRLLLQCVGGHLQPHWAWARACLSCSYVVAKFCGKKKKTSLKKRTVYPRWYETLSFNVDLPPLRFAPQVRRDF